MSIRLMLFTKKKNKRGLSPIYLRMNVGGRIRFVSTGHFIKKEQWDKAQEIVRGHPLSEEINADILQKKRNAFQAFIKIKSVDAVKEAVVTGNNFFSFAESFVLSVTRKRAALTISNYKKHLNKLGAFVRSRELLFEDITPAFLNEFEEWIFATTKTRKAGSNYAAAIMKTMRMFINAAKKKGLTNSYPFEHYEMPKQTAGDKQYLTMKELDLWTAFYKKCSNNTLRQSALYFLLGCYSGLRVSDWYRFDFRGGDYLTIRAKKNKSLVSIPIHGRLKYVLSEIRKLPLTISEIEVNRSLKDIASSAGIEKYLSTHSARRTFAVTMCLERGIRSEYAAEMMGITLNTFISSYSKITGEKVKEEASRAWSGL